MMSRSCMRNLFSLQAKTRSVLALCLSVWDRCRVENIQGAVRLKLYLSKIASFSWNDDLSCTSKHEDIRKCTFANHALMITG